jgi:16S rRNA (guanine527-N7)-methyltransferase
MPGLRPGEPVRLDPAGTCEANQGAPFRYTVCPFQRWVIGLDIVATAQADLEKRLADGLPLVGAVLTDEQVASLARFLRLLDKWNKAFNLTGVRDPLEMVTRHVLDSISAGPYLHGISILDVGTGAGLPGIPLAIMEPQRQFSLLDSGGKKIRFVRHAVGELAIGNVSVVHERVEDYEPADPFDMVLCRALTSIGDFVRRCGHLAGKNGRLLAMKGRFPEQELAGLPGSWEVAEVAAVNVPDLAGDRHIVVLRRREI